MADRASEKPGRWPILVLGLLAFPTAFWIAGAITLRYYRWLWNVPPPDPSAHGELRGLSASEAFALTWQSSLLLALWLLVWWLIFVRRSHQPLWANRRAMTALAVFATFTAVMAAWVLISYPKSLY